MTKRIERKVAAFEEAVREHAFIGAAMPEDREAINATYELRKQQLMTAIYMIMDAAKIGKAK